MHNKFSWLQLFADGTGDGGAATSGETSAAAGQNTGVNVSVAAGQTAPKTTADRLAELGVPKENSDGRNMARLLISLKPMRRPPLRQRKP